MRGVETGGAEAAVRGELTQAGPRICIRMDDGCEAEARIGLVWPLSR